MTTISGSGAHASVAGTDRAPFSKEGAAGYHDVDALLAYARTVLLDADDALAADSDTVAATQQAVKAYITALLAAKAPLANPTFTGTPAAPTAAASTNTTQIATTAMVQAAIAAYLSLNDVERLKGAIDCSSNPNYPAADAGDGYRVSVAGKIGGASGVNVDVGDKIVCFTDSSASGNHATVGANWFVLNTNIDGAVVNPSATPADEDFAIFDGTTGKIIKRIQKALIPQRLANITALRAATWTSALAPVVVMLDRAWNVGDGGGGVFVLDSSDTTSADDHGTIILTSTSGTALRYKRVFGANAVKAEWFGATGDGTTDDTTALTRALASAAKIVELANAKEYLIASGLAPQAGGGFVTPTGRRGWLKAKTGSGGFNIKNVGGTRTDADRCMFRALQNDTVLDNVGFKTDGATEVVIYPTRASNVSNLIWRKLAFTGFAAGVLCGINSVVGTHRIVEIDYATSCGVTQGTSYWTGVPQTTVLEIDNDIVSSTASKPVRAIIHYIQDILFSGTALTDFAQQTDGVNVVSQGSNTSVRHEITIGIVDGVGEALDIQANGGVYRIGTAKNCYHEACKIIHGGSENEVHIGVVDACGRAAVGIWGSSASNRDSRANVVRIGVVRNPGTYGLGASTTTCIAQFGDMGQTYKPKGNRVYIDSFEGNGVDLDYAVYDTAASSQSLSNDDMNQVIVGRGKGFASGSVSANPNNVRVKYEDKAYVELAIGANQTLATGTDTTVDFSSVTLDTHGLAVTASDKVRVQWPGLYRIEAGMRITTPDAGDYWEARALQGTGVKKVGVMFAPNNTNYPVLPVETIIYVKENQLGAASADLSIQAWQGNGNNETIFASAGYTIMKVVGPL